MTDTVERLICSSCGFPLDEYNSGLRYFGTHAAHVEWYCTQRMRGEIDRLRSEIESLRKDAECWRAAKADADQWGSALNAASWAQLDAYRKHIGETESARFFNCGKSILRGSIGAYLTAIDAAMKEST